MNKIPLFILSLFLSVQSYGQERYTIEIVFPDHSLDGSYLTLSGIRFPQDSGDYLLDSALVVKKKFFYEGLIAKEPFLACFYSEKIKQQTCFIIEPGTIFVQVADWQDAGIPSGTPINDDYAVYVEQQNKASRISSIWRTKRREGFKNRTWTNDDEKEYRSALLGPIHKSAKNSKLEFMDKYAHYSEIVRTMLFPSLISGNQRSVQYILDKMPEAARDTLYYRLIQQREQMKELAKGLKPDSNQYIPTEVIPDHLQAGKPYVDFTGKTPEGAQTKFSALLSGKKLILLDFWASWCSPCIREMPIIAAMHRKYQDQGLLVIGITSDTKETAWRKAIEQHGMTWLQLNSIEGESNIGSLYNIKSIPYTVIVDGNGIIVSRGLRGERLQAKIDELMAGSKP